MFKTITFATLLALAYAEDNYAEHNNHIEVDSTLSTQQVGLIMWAPFFREMARTLTEPAADTISGYDSEVHACFFVWQLGQWAVEYDDDRF